MPAIEERYVFRGNAVGVSGRIVWPEDYVIWVQGASSLPVTGGYARSQVGRSEFAQYLSFEAAATQASGDYSEPEKAYKTLVSASAKGVTVARSLTIDVVEATLTSITAKKDAQPSIVPTGTRIEGVRLDGYAVSVKLDIDLFTKLSTKDKLSEAYSSDDDFFVRYGHRFFGEPGTAPRKRGLLRAKGGRKIPEARGYILCSLAEEIRCEHPRVKIEGHTIALPGYGKIHLGELLITEASRRLTMVRVKLGSPQRGDMAVAEIESNGQGLP
jgi:hypothetical protein